jgi:peptidoglycan-associated lipoprotein
MTSDGGGKMRRNKLFWIGLVPIVLLLSVAFLTGCAKKAIQKEEPMVAQGEKQMTQAPAKAVTDDREARERALREQELREQALKDQAARDQAARDQAARDQAARDQATRDQTAREAAERAKREAAEKESSILKELQIPDIHFDFDKYNLKPEAQAILKAGAPAYLKYKEYKLVIEGNCDERGTVEYNLALGQKRADEAAKYLIDLGIEKERIKTISYGKERPLDPEHNEAAWAKNRRDQFVVSRP